MLKMIGVFIILIIATGVAILIVLWKRPAAPEDYQQTTQTGGAIETKYMANGPYEVSFRESTVLLDLGKFLVYYPSELETGMEKYPVIVICNGSGTPLSKYPAVARHQRSKCAETACCVRAIAALAPYSVRIVKCCRM